jgi:hypothetical protein
MPLDIHSTVTAVGRRDEDVGPSHAAAHMVRGQPPSEDQRRCAFHRLERCCLCVRSVFGDNHSVGMERNQVGEDFRLEGVAALEQSLPEWVRWDRLCRLERVVLRADGALLGDVSALERDA